MSLLEFFMATIECNVPKMVGRDKELDQLKEFLHAAINGKGNTVLVSGEAGIGKTRLVKELEAYSESLGIKVLEGRCLYESPTPFLPFREALRSIFQVSKSDALPLRERKIKGVVKEFAPDFVKTVPIVGQILEGLGWHKKYKLVYMDLLKEYPRIQRSECRVAIAQIGVSRTGDVLSEFYEEKAGGLLGLRKDKVEAVRFKVKNMIEAAHSKGVNILLFPELTVDLNYGQILEEISSLAKAYEMYIIPGSYHDRETRRNVSVVVGPDGILWQQEKHIPATIQYEGRRLEEGIEIGTSPQKTIVCDTEFGRIAIAICRDFLDMDLRVELKNFEPPVDLVFNPAFTPVTEDFKAAHFDARRSIYAYCFFANVAEFGDSLIYTPEKERVERTIPPREEGLIYKDVDLFKLRSERKKWEIEQKNERQFIQSTRGYVSETVLSETATPQARIGWGTLFERDEGLEAISRMLVAISGKQPILLFIDDLHLADTSSLSLLYYLARDVQNSKILVVGAYRPEEVTKTYEGTVHPLLDIMQRMSRDDLFRKIELKRLSQINYFDFILSMLDVDLDDLVKLIYEETEGNPFFAIETLRLLMQQKVLTKEDEHWKLSKNIEEVEIPPRVYDVVVSRINALRDEERDILDCASVVGEEFSSGVIENVSGLNRIGLLKCLNSVERRYHLVHSFEDGYRFDHSKIREVLYNEIAPELRKEYHSMIAKYMEEANKDSLERVVSELAYHYYQSGNAQKGIPYLLKAGKDAEEKWAAFEAVRFCSQALEMMGDDERWRHERTKTLEALGDVYAFTGQHEKANECYEKGMGIAKDDIARDRMRRKMRKKMILKKNGVKLAYYVYGEGEPTLVFVVAWIGSAELWIPQVDYFSQKFKMVTIDMRGAGESDKPADNYTIDLHVEDLNSIIEELQEKNIVLIGESMGAQIAIKYVTTHPGKVSKLVLIGGTPKIIASGDFPDGFPLEVSQRLLTLFQESYSRGLRTFIKFVFPEAGTEYLRESAFAVCQKTTKEIAINCFSNFLKEDLRPLLGKIDIPTLIIHGENDRLILLEAAKYMHENIPGSKMYVFKDKGHAPSITAADKFNKILEEFIKTGKLLKD
ncbi:MAG TPA: alpha/beta fold hydrolase [candidate division Zixibacteria bacterium]|nr:alpha/beta fold hydrolase [candidate division Zixibacteria bacterium]